MKAGTKTCPYCSTRMEFAAYELVDCLPGESLCLGCVRLLAILAASKRLAAAVRVDQPELIDLSPQANLTRLRAILGAAPAPVDVRKVAAGDQD